jgi:[histone H3]-lysine36 N-trimethyltransferase
VQDPRTISKKQERHVKMYMKEYLDKAVGKHREHEKRAREKEAAKQNGAASASLITSPRGHVALGFLSMEEDDEVKLTDDEEEEDHVVLKRKHVHEQESNSKRAKTEEDMGLPPPPPPEDDAEMELAEGRCEVEMSNSLNREVLAG